MNARSEDFEKKTPVAPKEARQPPAPGDGTVTPVEVPSAKRGGRRRALMLSVPLLIAVTAGGFWLFGGRFESTDNAYVHQAMITVSPDVSGRVAEVLVHENQTVAPGTPLFRLDATDYRLALDSAEARLAGARLAVATQRAAYETANAQLAAAQEIEIVKERELERQRELTARGIGSQAALDEATVATRTASNAVAVAASQRDAAAAALGGDPGVETDSLPSVRAAILARDAARRQLDQTEIRAASGGTISQLESLNVGQFVAAGTGIATIVADGQSWVEANFKETQLDLLRTGQPVDLEVDAYPGLRLHGRIDSFGAATGSQFSLIPAQNATGNWVKVVQRVPVRIEIDQPSERPLRDGMSVTVAVDTGANRLARMK